MCVPLHGVAACLLFFKFIASVLDTHISILTGRNPDIFIGEMCHLGLLNMISQREKGKTEVVFHFTSELEGTDILLVSAVAA